MPNKIALDVLLFLFGKDSFFDPSDRLPPLELDDNLIGVDSLDKVEEDVSLDGIACEVERFIHLYECRRHQDIISVDPMVNFAQRSYI